ncbi:E3 ubiquitin-protein ligase SIAH1 [Strongyloides ratti]|uniref:E3 ubiquitin-protein ligase n=1 Tax=Strongyloides ratti TaxID=34506 RepID=A0A090KSD0_STRRB|nr:E3 ubiquitin-protein ligase SIAH1 [Strongyloides ratti]CEF60420.1 E3 ubiquitin-protein ligase SIAH1 [Strongyloides ratti]
MSNRHRSDRESKNERSTRRGTYRNSNRANSEELINISSNNEGLEVYSSSGSSNSMESDIQPSQIVYNRSSSNRHFQRQNQHGRSGGSGNNHNRNRATARIVGTSENSNIIREGNVNINSNTNHISSDNRIESRSVTRNNEEPEPKIERKNNSRIDERMDFRSSGERSNNRSNYQISENIDNHGEGGMNITIDDSSIDEDRMDILNESFPLSRTIDQSESRNNSKNILKNDRTNFTSTIDELRTRNDITLTNKLLLESLNKPVPASADVLNAFECPVCMEYMVPPLYQCGSGHLVCGSCRPKLNCCPSCRGPVPNVRNLAMEKIAATIYFPCKYNVNGCNDAFSASEKLSHEEGCEFRPYCCPCPGASCRWQGGVEHVMPHLMKAHRSITTLQGEDIVFLATDISLPGAVDWVMLQSCYGCHFMLVLEKQEKYGNTEQFYAIVQLIGSKKEAEQFIYRLELSNQKRRLCWEAAPKSIHEGIASSLNSSDCLLFDSKLAKLFSENGNLGINVTITKV